MLVPTDEFDVRDGDSAAGFYESETACPLPIAEMQAETGPGVTSIMLNIFGSFGGHNYQIGTLMPPF